MRERERERESDVHITAGRKNLIFFFVLLLPHRVLILRLPTRNLVEFLLKRVTQLYPYCRAGSAKVIFFDFSYSTISPVFFFFFSTSLSIFYKVVVYFFVVVYFCTILYCFVFSDIYPVSLLFSFVCCTYFNTFIY